MVESPIIHTIHIEELMTLSISGYKKQTADPFDELKKVSFIKKLWNERQLKIFINNLFEELEPYMPELREQIESESETTSPALEKVKPLLINSLKEMDKKKLLYDLPFLDHFIKEGFLDAAESFLLRSRQEDAELSNEEVFQALRNVWIMNSLQLCWDIPLKLTTPMYAYSMLYPYTDNLLDDPEIDSRDKKEFNQKLSRVLSGESVQSSNVVEERIFSLVRQIKETFPKDTYPEVTESIQLIHAAQIESLLQGEDEPLSEAELLNISFFKGGTSVLADAYLVKGLLTEKEMAFAFHFGAFLQLLDDLQDKKEDQSEQNQTLFSTKQTQESTDKEIRRLISYIYSVNSKDASDTHNAALMKDIISQCTLIMIMEAVGKNSDSVTPSLYKELESYSKVRLKTYQTLQKKFEEFLKY